MLFRFCDRSLQQATNRCVCDITLSAAVDRTHNASLDEARQDNARYQGSSILFLVSVADHILFRAQLGEWAGVTRASSTARRHHPSRTAVNG